jgi:hypothetical protein
MQISNGIEHGSIDGLYICIYIYALYTWTIRIYICIYVYVFNG